MKTCTKCNIKKNIYDFGRKKSHQDGLQYWCKLCHKDYKKVYYNNNLDDSRLERTKWKATNKSKVLEYQKKYISKRYQEDKIFRIIKNQRNRLKEVLTVKPCSFSKAIGCSSVQLKKHIESQFEPWMNWDNYGPCFADKLTWNVDHIKPLSSFDLTKEEQFKEACHFSNLKPLKAKDNIIKSNKIGVL